MATLTSANAILSLAVANLFSAPQTIQGYAVDDAFESEAVQQAEVQMGVDGRLNGGKVFTPYKMTIHILPTSPSVPLFDTWRTQQDAQYDVFTAAGTVVLPSTGMSYTLQKGYLTSATPFPGVKKLLEPLVYEITWERIISAPNQALTPSF
jgi:hypothetical protein